MNTINSIIEDWKIPWSGKGEFNHYNHILMLVLIPLGIATMVFFRKQLRKLFSEKGLRWSMIGLGTFMFIWELWFDIDSVLRNYSNNLNSTNPTLKAHAASLALGEQFNDGLEMCRLNMYVCGLALMVSRKGIMYFAATAFFGGYSTFVDHYTTTASMHSVITHTSLSWVPVFFVIMLNKDYKSKDVAIMYGVNLSYTIYTIIFNDIFHTTHAVLSIKELKDNLILSWAPGASAVVLWVLLVMVLAGIFVFFHKLFWRLDNGYKGKWFAIDFSFFNFKRKKGN